ncbi:hypothetical protein COW36_01000 [bacterium (Candidatus Blackallbacteria) CG17_big_fil_post_rev_8_21_14_2_50_48_46]|uniref:Uncharacterized protein n=1 Tax=bacterium (Candidatus Blackallbacteria) CG17_big_fil_post_rev_8_21_14_2_50_48_46 TaxID=2014261 RepID=A0A2M7GB92_9BACT|nr:MAG: hypothetical protein COW64_10175 [bacterium (Candidatus Blackallbacteria) CG18_big_fil_WC_8_21_14_2_50_49_26]PIW19445.1 MAG: hypothetical protein COW36_01000 [bacterium (Candidatus Blackallbacteria) CG17_big_fil_post_rev_8_21_14_2_50_48_46]PIW48951.1 MAG: hypothetical protein COW20_07455 [bacterium (Candidatus Blackallbacteria) CG13_big_fil_rev_8_21_14_2_50_49_14]
MLEPNTYLLSQWPLPPKNPYLARDKDTGGLVIQNLSHLTLRGRDVRATKLLVSEHFPHSH